MAGSSMTFTYDEVGAINKIIVDWVSDDGTGAVSGVSKKISGFLLKAVTNPGAVAPSDDYDIVITDEESFNVLANQQDDLIDRDTATTEEVYFYIATGTVPGVPVSDLLTIAITAAGNSKAGRLILYWMRPER